MKKKIILLLALFAMLIPVVAFAEEADTAGNQEESSEYYLLNSEATYFNQGYSLWYNLTFNKSVEKFEKILVDSEEVYSNYEKSPTDSNTIRIRSEFFNKLEANQKHTLLFVFEDGSYEFEITVLEEDIEGTRQKLLEAVTNFKMEYYLDFTVDEWVEYDGHEVLKALIAQELVDKGISGVFRFDWTMEWLSINDVEFKIKLLNDSTPAFEGIIKVTYKDTVTDEEEPSKPKNDYEFLNGAEQEYEYKKGSKLSFRVDIPYSDFIASGKVYVDGNLVNPNAYIISEGSTIITFTDDYAIELALGTHTLKLTLGDGSEATTTFNVKKASDEEDVPYTLDNITFNIIVLLISISGLVGTVLYKKQIINQ